MPDDLFTEMVARGHAAFALWLQGRPLTAGETALVDAAVAAGVLGAVEVLRDDQGDGNGADSTP